MPTRHRSAFRGDPAGVREMRRWLRGHLGSHCPRADDIDLVATELATNAIRHSYSAGYLFAVAVEVEHEHGGPDVWLTVEDLGGATEPRVQRSAGDGGHGYGLALVNELSDAWGVDGDVFGRDVWAQWNGSAATNDCGHWPHRREHDMAGTRYSLRSLLAAALLGPGLLLGASPSGCDCGSGPSLPETRAVDDCGGVDAPDDRNLTTSVERLADRFGYTEQQVRRAFHTVKREAGLGGKEVKVDIKSGEVYPQIPRGGVGDSVGNIFDHLP